MQILDQLTYDISIKPSDGSPVAENYQTVTLYDSIEHENHPFRQLSSEVKIKGKPYILTIRLSLVDNDELVLAIGSAQVVLIFLLVLGLILNRSLSKKLWKPFYRTLSQLKAYELDKSESIETDKQTSLSLTI